MMLRGGSTGTDVNSAITSYEQRHLHGWRVTLLTLYKVFSTLGMTQ